MLIKTFEDLCDFLESCIVNKCFYISGGIERFQINTIRFQSNFSNLKTPNTIITGVEFKENYDSESGRFHLYTTTRVYYGCIYNYISKLMYYTLDPDGAIVMFYSNINKESTMNYINDRMKDYTYKVLEQVNKLGNNYSKIKNTILN